MPIAQRTVNPLHFEDLEPHRFEDLVRQVAYNWRSWRYLDATGAGGNDEGVDIRGIEAIGNRYLVVTSDEDDSGPDPEPNDRDTEKDAREWLISCKRYQRLGPTEARSVVRETLKDPDNAPYGYVLAVACDLSADALAAVREEAFSLGVQEAHIWSRSHLEDLLFRPEYEGLLFVYFGLSIRAKRNSRIGQIRAESSIRRSLKAALGIGDLTIFDDATATIRDIEDEAYPFASEVEDFALLDAPPWHLARIVEFHPIGMVVERFSYWGVLSGDGTWDVDPRSRRDPAYSSGMREQEYWNLVIDYPDIERVTAEDCEDVTILEYWMLPYSSIVFVDSISDGLRSTPMVYCRFSGDDGPYSDLVQYRGWRTAKYGLDYFDVDTDKRSQLLDQPDAHDQAVQRPKTSSKEYDGVREATK